MKIALIFPCPATRPSGGVKVLLQYANCLADEHEVTAVFVPFKPPKSGVFRNVKAFTQYCFGRVSLLKWRPDWFELDSRVDCIWLSDARKVPLHEYQHIILSFWHTAAYLRDQTTFINRCSYLVQEYEYYRSANNDERSVMDDNFASGFNLMAISPAVENILRPFKNAITKMPNGIEFDHFYLSKPIDSAKRNLVLFPARPESFKRTLDAVAAIEKLPKSIKDRYQFACFGLEQPNYIQRLKTANIKFYQQPSNTQLHNLLNSCAVFITPSEFEGWGLPGAEAMACGAALVSTNNGGVNAYATHDDNAIIVEVGDVDALSDAVAQLLKDPERRQKIASRGQAVISTFTWQAAGQRMLNYIEAVA